MVANDVHEDDPRDQLDGLRARIRRGDLPAVSVTGSSSGKLPSRWPTEEPTRQHTTSPVRPVVQRALAAEGLCRVAAQVRVMLGQGAGRPDYEVFPLAAGARP